MRERKARQPVFSGQFYSADQAELKSEVSRYINDAELDSEIGSVRAIVAPHAGYVYSGSTAGFAYRAVRDAFKDCTSKVNVVILGPSHQAMFSGVAETSADVWKIPLGDVQIRHISGDVDEDLIFKSDQVHNSEHSIEVQLPFLQVALDDVEFEVTPLLLSNIDSHEVVKLLKSEFLDMNVENEAGKSNTLFIASTDLSHYKPIIQAKSIDKETIKSIENLDMKSLGNRGDACGKLPVMVLMELAKQEGWEPKLLDYSTSAEASGDESAVVGYAAFSFS